MRMQEIGIMDEDISTKGGMLKGWQWVSLILEHFKTDRSIDKMWQVEDIYKMAYPGDSALGAFRFMWLKHCATFGWRRRQRPT